jgi:hypothetical protein
MPVLVDPLLSGLVALVVAYCLVRALAPAGRGRSHRHRRDIDAWHVVMGVAMICMLLGRLSRPLAVVALVLAGAAVCWGALSTERRSGSAAHVRLLVGATAMAVMTLPLAAPAEAAGTAPASSGMSGMSLGGTPSVLLVVLLVAALGVVLTARLPAVVRSGSGAVTRLDACCDVVMAGAMAVMLAALL